MAQRWGLDRVLELAPDASAKSAARKLTSADGWGERGAADLLVWGVCTGSGSRPLRTAIDLDGPEYLCSCTARKAPCKHALALLLAWADGEVVDSAPAEFALTWKTKKDESAAKRKAARERREKQEISAARRAANRIRRVDRGFTALDTWMSDHVTNGIARMQATDLDAMAKTMVDASAPAVAARLRDLIPLVASADDWPRTVVTTFASLHRLGREHARLTDLDPGSQATIRRRVGYPAGQETALQRAGVPDTWTVLGFRYSTTERLETTRIWLRGSQSGRLALLLSFKWQRGFTRRDDELWAADELPFDLQPGAAGTATLHFYPGRPELRATLGPWGAQIIADSGAPPVATFAEMFGEWARVLEADPWTVDWPVIVRGVPVLTDAGWTLAEPSGCAIPMLPSTRTDLAQISVRTGGAALPFAGTWNGRELSPLAAWIGDPGKEQAIKL